MTDEKINKKNKFLKKLTFVIETEFGQPDDMILDLIEEHQISRKEVTEIYEQEKLNKNSKLTDEAIECLKEWSTHGTFWNHHWDNWDFS
jgi:hypothetical protein